MNTTRGEALAAVGLWGRFPLYPAKIGTHGSTSVIVRRVRRFAVGQKIAFVEYGDLLGVSKGFTPAWRWGTVWRIDDGRLFIEL